MEEKRVGDLRVEEFKAIIAEVLDECLGKQTEPPTTEELLLERRMPEIAMPSSEYRENLQS